MGAEVIILANPYNYNFLKGLTHSALIGDELHHEGNDDNDDENDNFDDNDDNEQNLKSCTYNEVSVVILGKEEKVLQHLCRGIHSA